MSNHGYVMSILNQILAPAFLLAVCGCLVVFAIISFIFFRRHKMYVFLFDTLMPDEQMICVTNRRHRIILRNKNLLKYFRTNQSHTMWIRELFSHESSPLSYEDAWKAIKIAKDLTVEIALAEFSKPIIIMARRVRLSFFFGVLWSVKGLPSGHSDKNHNGFDNQFLSGIINESPIGIVSVDDVGCIKECNLAFSAMAEGVFGQMPAHENLKQNTIIQLIDASNQDGIRGILSFLRGDAVESPIQIVLAGVRGATVNVYFKKSHTKQDPLHTLYLVDISELKRISQQFAQSQKMQAIGQLAGGIAHDFNNLLTAMIGFCDLLLLRHSPSDLSFNDIMQIKHNANRAANLVRQLLAFSRQQTLHLKTLNVTDLLSNLTSLLRRLIGPAIDLRISYEQNLGLIKADQGQFEQVITNLVVNARDAMPNGGALKIETKNVSIEEYTPCINETIPPGQYVLIEVNDNGQGIASEHIANIFEPFFSTKEVGAGTGLGLSMVYGIVKQSGGFINVNSKLNAGTSFQIYWPLLSENSLREVPVQNNIERALRTDLSGSAAIMLVEDEDSVRMYAARALRDKGHKVFEAANGQEALDIIKSEDSFKIDVLVTDVIMAPIDGPSLAAQARVLFPDLKIIFISGYAEDSLRQQLQNIPNVHFLPKPFELKELASKVKDVILPPAVADISVAI